MMERHTKKIFPLGIVLALMLSGSQVMAANNSESGITHHEISNTQTQVTLHTLSNMSGSDRTTLTPMTDNQLDAIYGARNYERSIRVSKRTAHVNINVGLNIAVSNQINVCGVCSGVSQNTSRFSFQSLKF